MIEVSEQKSELILEGEDLFFQPAVFKGLTFLEPNLKPELVLFFGLNEIRSADQRHKGFHSST